jgi:hypothetical protein
MVTILPFGPYAMTRLSAPGAYAPPHNFLYASAECCRLYRVGLLRHPVVSRIPVGHDAKVLVDVHATAHHLGLDIPRCFPILVPPCMDALVSIALIVAVSAQAASGSRRACLSRHASSEGYNG